jgi:hypothetical protein
MQSKGRLKMLQANNWYSVEINFGGYFRQLEGLYAPTMALCE